MEIHSEKAWFNHVRKNFKDLFPNINHRTRYNRTRRNLMQVISTIRKEISKYLGYSNADILIVDSMPIPVCGFGRAHFSKRFRDISSYGYITDIALTAANVDDGDILWELLPSTHEVIVLGDKGYIGDQLAQELAASKNIERLALKRNNSKNPYPKTLRNCISRHRRRIETSFAQLAEQFHVNEVLANSIDRLKARIESKIWSSLL